MARKMYLNVTLRVIVDVEEGMSVDSVMDNLNFNVDSESENVDVVDSEVENFNLIDSK